MSYFPTGYGPANYVEGSTVIDVSKSRLIVQAGATNPGTVVSKSRLIAEQAVSPPGAVVTKSRIVVFHSNQPKFRGVHINIIED